MALDADVELKALLNLLYMPPGRELEGDFETPEGEPIRVRIEVQANEVGREQREIAVSVRLLNKAFGGQPVRALIENRDQLVRAWAPDGEVDLSDLLQRTSLEQAIYQDPGLMMIGAPGLLGAAPPAYFLGLPFSLPPAPPSQLREAVLGPPDQDP